MRHNENNVKSQNRKILDVMPESQCLFSCSEPTKGTQEEWYVMPHMKGKGTKLMNIEKPSIIYAQVISLKPPLEVKIPPPQTL